MCRVELPDGTPAWLVLREADVRSALADTRLSVDRSCSRNSGYKGFSLPPALDANLLNLDGDTHIRLRRLVMRAFTYRRIGDMRNDVIKAAERLSDKLDSSSTCDLVTDFATPLPLQVIGDMFDVPEEHRRPFAAWVGTMFALERPQQVRDSIDNIHQFLLRLVAERRREPGQDLLSALIAARDDHDRLTEDELVSLAFLLLSAGVQNVQHLISNGIHTLLQHPEQLAELRSEPSLLTSAVEELMRFAHPNQMSIRRFPTEPVQLGGVTIPAGDTVMLCVASANRDPARYPDPDTFDIRREDKSHLALGHGVHFLPRRITGTYGDRSHHRYASPSLPPT
ncbi:cytochrome P450 [Streptomyces noursei]|uniref:cytochrome P450 n=1 Tax=Streptomyces noursei TaxID=1971 RepID=UPI0021A3FA80|nr:cytochrome P450 [Streptomyces noursei]UWS69870.1 cytochrome P450 [Streptomyces noursei]